MSASGSLGRQFSHPDDAIFKLPLSRGRWTQHVKPLSSEHVQDGRVDWKSVPEGVYEVPTHLLAVEDPGRVRKKTGSATERSIAAQGIRTPIDIGMSENGSVGLTDGNHRVQAAHNLGLPTVPVRFLRATPERMQRFFPSMRP